MYTVRFLLNFAYLSFTGVFNTKSLVQEISQAICSRFQECGGDTVK